MRDRLYRSRDERVLFGVAGGVAEWLDIDPALVRIVFALLVLTAGFGLLLYIIMAIVIPEEPELVAAPPAPGDPSAPATPAAGPTWTDARSARRAARRAARAERDGRGVVIFGAILIVVGAWFLLDQYIPDLNGDLLGPVILIVIGGLLLAGAMTRGVGSGRGNPPAQG
jgi:phage shock protein PspC (stress-responsive transcriptional regulator)